MNEDRQYPIGRLVLPTTLSHEARAQAIDSIDSVPARLDEIVRRLGERIDLRYREGGWTGRQVVHHLVDSHTNAWIRFKLVLTEDRPTLRPYDEKKWARLPDHSCPPEQSVALIAALHRHWVSLMRGIPSETWQRNALHPEVGEMTLDALVANYAWHGEHHLAHLNLILQDAVD